ncbi:MAG: TolC family protein [Candidatus Krumholzibacteria bacterium]|nr:TolC family protein [Candidatus Krumholzibacteria bacterium]
MNSFAVSFKPLKSRLLFGALLVFATAALAEEGPTFTRAEPLGPIIKARAGSPEVLDLEACVQEALLTNDQLVAERLRGAELAGQMKQALSTGLPTLDLVGDWSHGRDPSFALDSTFGGGGGDGSLGTVPGADPWFDDWLTGFGSLIPAPADIEAQTFWRANANLNWTINPLQIMGAVGAAKLGISQQELEVTAVEHDTANRTLVAYYSIVKGAERIRAVEAELANQTELLDIMTLRYEMGMATRLDTLQAAVTRANIVPRLSIAIAGLRNEGSRLNALMGRRPETPLSIANDQAIETDTVNDEVALKLAQMRPELAASGMFVDILHKKRQAEIADNRPYLTLFGSYGYVGTETNSVFDDGHDAWRASVALTVPIFDGLNTRGRVAETDAMIRRTGAELTGRRRDVQVEVLEILANLRMARQILGAVILNLERSEEVLEESLLMLQMGKVNYLDVLVSESNRATAHSNVIDARYEVLVLTSSLKRSVGYSPLLPLTAIPNLTGEVVP